MKQICLNKDSSPLLRLWHQIFPARCGKN